MESGGWISSPPLAYPSPPSWAQITSALGQQVDNSPIYNAQVLNKLKETMANFVRLDEEAISQA